MDRATYESWWALHLRVARGEALSLEEKTPYEGGRRQLEQGEILADPRVAARAALDAVKTLEEEQGRLRTRKAELEGEIVRLEALLGEAVREPLATGR